MDGRGERGQKKKKKLARHVAQAVALKLVHPRSVCLPDGTRQTLVPWTISRVCQQLLAQGEFVAKPSTVSGWSNRSLPDRDWIRDADLPQVIQYVTEECSRGAQSIFTNIEYDMLIALFETFNLAGQSLSRAKANEFVMMYAKLPTAHGARKRQFEQDKPSGKWWKKFMKYAKRLTWRKGRTLESTRALALSEDVLSSLPTLLEAKFSEHPQLLEDDGGRICNFDESEISTRVVGETVLSSNWRRVPLVQGGKGNSLGAHITGVFVVAANGSEPLPPVLIFTKKISDTQDVPTGSAMFARSDNGYMTAGLFNEYFDTWLTAMRKRFPTGPLMMVMDGSSTHRLTEERLVHCHQTNVHICILPAHTSTETQPLDRTVFGLFKLRLQEHYRNAIAHHLYSNDNKMRVHCSLLAWQQVMKYPHVVRAGFEKTGIYPLNKTLYKEFIVHQQQNDLICDLPPPLEPTPTLQAVLLPLVSFSAPAPPSPSLQAATPTLRSNSSFTMASAPASVVVPIVARISASSAGTSTNAEVGVTTSAPAARAGLRSSTPVNSPRKMLWEEMLSWAATAKEQWEANPLEDNRVVINASLAVRLHQELAVPWSPIEFNHIATLPMTMEVSHPDQQSRTLGAWDAVTPAAIARAKRDGEKQRREAELAPQREAHKARMLLFGIEQQKLTDEIDKCEQELDCLQTSGSSSEAVLASAKKLSDLRQRLFALKPPKRPYAQRKANNHSSPVAATTSSAPAPIPAALPIDASASSSDDSNNDDERDEQSTPVVHLVHSESEYEHVLSRRKRLQLLAGSPMQMRERVVRLADTPAESAAKRPRWEDSSTTLIAAQPPLTTNLRSKAFGRNRMPLTTVHANTMDIGS